MHCALNDSAKFSKLIVCDISPVKYRESSLFSNYLNIMKNIEQMKLKSREDVERIMKESIPVIPSFLIFFFNFFFDFLFLFLLNFLLFFSFLFFSSF